MSRKPIDKQQPSECRQAIWDEIRKQKGAFTAKDLDVKLEPSSIKEYLTGLIKAGFIEKTDIPFTSPNKTQHYRLANDTGIDAPRVRKDGSPVTQGQGQQYMWNTMRILKEFSAADLAFNSRTDDIDVTVTTAQKYCQALCKAGYLIHQSGREKSLSHRFRLLSSMWTGPQPPQIQRTKQVYDPNLQRVVWNKIEGGAH